MLGALVSGSSPKRSLSVCPFTEISKQKIVSPRTEYFLPFPPNAPPLTKSLAISARTKFTGRLPNLYYQQWVCRLTRNRRILNTHRSKGFWGIGTMTQTRTIILGKKITNMLRWRPDLYTFNFDRQIVCTERFNYHIFLISLVDILYFDRNKYQWNYIRSEINQNHLLTSLHNFLSISLPDMLYFDLLSYALNPFLLVLSLSFFFFQ